MVGVSIKTYGYRDFPTLSGSKKNEDRIEVQGEVEWSGVDLKPFIPVALPGYTPTPDRRFGLLCSWSFFGF